jgi:hypothetical protein
MSVAGARQPAGGIELIKIAEPGWAPTPCGVVSGRVGTTGGSATAKVIATPVDLLPT